MSDAEIIDALNAYFVETGRSGPQVFLIHPSIAALLCVWGFLRWGYEPLYTLEDWCREGDFLLVGGPAL